MAAWTAIPGLSARTVDLAMTSAEECRLRAREAEEHPNQAQDFEAKCIYFRIARHWEAIAEPVKRGFFHQTLSSSERS
jgi:hypothetical protein